MNMRTLALSVIGLLIVIVIALGIVYLITEGQNLSNNSNYTSYTINGRCYSDANCGFTSYCQFKSGICGGQGTCIELPQNCPDLYDPVCGCDQKTYTNECMMQLALVSKFKQGACTTGIASCTKDSDCASGSFCRFKFGICGGTGKCISQSSACDNSDNPVCGCDGTTYDNECAAYAADISISAYGDCGPDQFDVPLSCQKNKDCESSEFCKLTPGECGGTGKCAEMPDGCIDLYDPVCGCDGDTYGNICELYSEGISLQEDGACEPETRACHTNLDCGTNEFCQLRIDTCGGTGSCVSKPTGCTDLYDPVCGCNNFTYSNDCTMKAAGISRLHDGTCENQTTACLSNDNCASDMFCLLPDDTCGGTGTCSPKPEGCIEIYDPVCGCDNKTYSNVCFMKTAGISKHHEGTCAPPSPTCLSNSGCSAGNFCKLPEDTCGGTGICTIKPEACITLYDPVCGCDGKTYSNECMMEAAGISRSHDGICVTPPAHCSSNSDCALGMFCLLPDDDCGGAGTCTAKPRACITLYEPVCGCDNKTYSNECVMESVGMSRSHYGACRLPATCTTKSDCASGEFCQLPPNTCKGTGICAAMPRICITLYDPVCGCDGKTYSNGCVANSNGISLGHDGACTPICGNGICEDGEADYCPACVYAHPACVLPCTLGSCPKDCDAAI